MLSLQSASMGYMCIHACNICGPGFLHARHICGQTCTWFDASAGPPAINRLTYSCPFLSGCVITHPLEKLVKKLNVDVLHACVTRRRESLRTPLSCTRRWFRLRCFIWHTCMLLPCLHKQKTLTLKAIPRPHWLFAGLFGESPLAESGDVNLGTSSPFLGRRVLQQLKIFISSNSSSQNKINPKIAENSFLWDESLVRNSQTHRRLVYGKIQAWQVSMTCE